MLSISTMFAMVSDMKVNDAKNHVQQNHQKHATIVWWWKQDASGTTSSTNAKLSTFPLGEGIRTALSQSHAQSQKHAQTA